MRERFGTEKALGPDLRPSTLIVFLFWVFGSAVVRQLVKISYFHMLLLAFPEEPSLNGCGSWN